MGDIKTVKKLSKKYSMTPEEFIEYGSILALRDIYKRNIITEYCILDIRRNLRFERRRSYGLFTDILQYILFIFLFSRASGLLHI